MREISPAFECSADEFLATKPPAVKLIVERIRAQKQAGSRPRPSQSLLDCSNILIPEMRQKLLDKVAHFTDENLFGRSEMCIQFAILLERALKQLGFNAKAAMGEAIYYIHGKEIFRWEHAWVRIGHEVIDGNVDCLDENPEVPSGLHLRPYWGPITETPSDRKLCKNHSTGLPKDPDVDQLWWPDLERWMKEVCPI